MISLKRIEARDRRYAAVHEAGHLVVAHHLGVVGRHAVIWRTGEPSIEARSWLGRVYQNTKPPRAKALKIAVAGAVAENIWMGVDDPDAVDLATVSPTDLALAGLSPDAGLYEGRVWRAVSLTYGWLRRGGPLWPALVHEARRLIEAAQLR